MRLIKMLLAVSGPSGASN